MKTKRFDFKKILKEYNRLRVIRACGFDPYEYVKELRKVKEENERLKKEIVELKSMNSFLGRIQLENNELREQFEKFANMHNEFPVMLRKMWSGGEITSWMKKKQNEYFSTGKPTKGIDDSDYRSD